MSGLIPSIEQKAILEHCAPALEHNVPNKLDQLIEGNYKDFMASAIDKASEILLKKYQEGHRKNARWSQRAFAKRLGLSSGALSEILQGKRVLTAQVKKKLAEQLELSPLEKADFFADDLPEHLRENRLEYYRLSTDQFHLISDWWHYAILNLINTKGFKPLPSWISERLGLSLKVTHEAWERLFRLGHIKKQGQKIVRAYPRLNTTDDVINMSIQKAHIEDTKLIEQSLREIPLQYRDHTSMTMVMNKKDLAKAKELVRLFQDKMSNEVEVKTGDEVYRLSIALFPLTKITEKK